MLVAAQQRATSWDSKVGKDKCNKVVFISMLLNKAKISHKRIKVSFFPFHCMYLTAHLPGLLTFTGCSTARHICMADRDKWWLITPGWSGKWRMRSSTEATQAYFVRMKHYTGLEAKQTLSFSVPIFLLGIGQKILLYNCGCDTYVQNYTQLGQC